MAVIYRYLVGLLLLLQLIRVVGITDFQENLGDEPV